MKGLISNIQLFSIGDGPGIRTTVFMQGCNLRCPWCHNPETIAIEGSGKMMDKNEILDIILEDRDFYEDSGGGVTFSGGEPLLQAEFVGKLAKECKELGIHTILDTALSLSYDSLEWLIDFIDLFYIDIKSSKEEDYIKIIGGDLKLVTSNTRKLVDLGKEIVARIPLIPGFNDSPEDGEDMSSLLLDLGFKEAHILPFHGLASSKYKDLGFDYAYEGQKMPSKDYIKDFSKYFLDKGINCTIEE